jgi:hypothetical protein
LISQSAGDIEPGRRWEETGAYGGHGKEHYDELFLAKDRMLDEGIRESDEAFAAFVEEGG